MAVTLVSLWTCARLRLEAAGVDAPVLDARLLVESGAGVSRLDIITNPHRVMSEFQIEAVDLLVARRAAREPIGYILGRKGFWKLDLAIGPAVLIPRPETECVVEAALDFLPADKSARVLDLGVGSGAILLAVLAARPQASGLGVDKSAAALEIAAANARALGLDERARFVEAGWEVALLERFDLVVSNPPYIPSADIDGLAAELRFEPRLALDGGPDGLDAYRAIMAQLGGLLAPGGGFALEVGNGQAEPVAALARAQNLSVGAHRRDLAGVARVVCGRRPAEKLPAEKSLGS